MDTPKHFRNCTWPACLEGSACHAACDRPIVPAEAPTSAPAAPAMVAR